MSESREQFLRNLKLWLEYEVEMAKASIDRFCIEHHGRRKCDR